MYEKQGKFMDAIQKYQKSAQLLKELNT